MIALLQVQLVGGDWRTITEFHGGDAATSIDRAREKAELLNHLGFPARAESRSDDVIEADQVWRRKSDGTLVRIARVAKEYDDAAWETLTTPKRSGSIYGYNLRTKYERVDTESLAAGGYATADDMINALRKDS